MHKYGKGFEYLREKFPKLSDAKLTEVIFIGPQFREIISDDQFEHLLTETEKSAWVTFKAVCLNFLWKCKSRKLQGSSWGLVKRIPDYMAQYVSEDSVFTFPLGHLRSEPGSSERRTCGTFPQGYSTIKKWYAQKWSQYMTADYCWKLTEEASIVCYKRMSYRKKFEMWVKSDIYFHFFMFCWPCIPV